MIMRPGQPVGVLPTRSRPFTQKNTLAAEIPQQHQSDEMIRLDEFEADHSYTSSASQQATNRTFGQPKVYN